VSSHTPGAVVGQEADPAHVFVGTGIVFIANDPSVGIRQAHEATAFTTGLENARITDYDGELDIAPVHLGDGALDCP
jgi:hypothetical protein